ncbi:unnamed protein product, partial [marine sediment metagenome]
ILASMSLRASFFLSLRAEGVAISHNYLEIASSLALLAMTEQRETMCHQDIERVQEIDSIA